MTLTQDLSNFDHQIVDEINGRPISAAQLRAAFNRVADKSNWKNPIDATVDVSGEFDRLLIGHAVIYFAGCNVTIETVAPNRVRVTGIGYYRAVGA